MGGREIERRRQNKAGIRYRVNEEGERTLREDESGEDEERALVEFDAWQIWFSNLPTRILSSSPSASGSSDSTAAAAAHRTVRANFNFNC